MKKAFQITLIGGIILFQTIFVFGQGLDRLYIENIEVRSKYNASFLTSYSNVYLYKIESLKRSRIESLIREFESSGLFDRVKWEMIKQEGSGSSTLILTPVYRKDYETFILDNIVLDHLPSVDSQKFRQILVEDGIK